MISTFEVILQAQPFLHGCKPPLALSRQKSPAAYGNNRAPAMFVVGNDSKGNALRDATGIFQLFENHPSQINARNALLSHLPLSPAPRKSNTCKGLQGKPDLVAERVGR